MNDPRVVAAVIAGMISLFGIAVSIFSTRLQIRVKLLELELKLSTKRSGAAVQAALAKQGPDMRNPASSSREFLGRLERGQRTPQAAYRRPILQALHSLGGSARIRQVLEQVRELVPGFASWPV